MARNAHELPVPFGLRPSDFGLPSDFGPSPPCRAVPAGRTSGLPVASAILTREPCCSLYWPSTTMRSRRTQALLDYHLPLLDLGRHHRATVTGRTSIVWSSLMTKTKAPSGPRWMTETAPQRSRAYGQQQAGVDKLSWPQTQIGVGKRRFEFNRGTAGVDLVVNHGEFAFAQNGRVVLADRHDGEVGLAPRASFWIALSVCSGRMKTTEIGRS